MCTDECEREVTKVKQSESTEHLIMYELTNIQKIFWLVMKNV